MKANILNFTGTTIAELNPDTVIEKSIGQYQSVVVCGYDKDGELVIRFTQADAPEALWCLQKSIHALMDNIR